MTKGMKNNNGFTLVELMIAVAMTGILTAVVYATYTIQQKTTTAQYQVTEMQQNIRNAILTMVQEFRMAGYDPELSAGAGITSATAANITFTKDDDGDGDLDSSGALPWDTNENLSYGFNAADDTNNDGIVDVGEDNNGDGVINDDDLVGALRRDNNGGAGLQAIAENIQAIEFFYTEYDDSTSPPTVSTNTIPTNIENIRAVTISILARAANRDPGFVNNADYIPASSIADGTLTPWDLNGATVVGTAPNDNYRRRLQITTVQCRNMGLEENEINF